MKKYLFSIAFLGFVAVNVTAQNPADYLHSATSENEVYYEIEDLGRGNVLSDFLSFVIRQQHSEAHRTRQSGLLPSGILWQGSAFLGTVQNSPAKIRHWPFGNGSMQLGIGLRYQINPRHSILATQALSWNNYNIRNGLANNILGEHSQIPLMGRPVDEVSEEILSTFAWGLTLAYRFNFDRNRRFGDIGSYLEFGAFGGWSSGRYSVTFTDDNSTTTTSYSYSGIFNPFKANIQATIGWHETAIFVKYRLTNPLRNLDASLPQFSIGVRTIW